MSVVIAIKDDDKVYIAADSLCSSGSSKVTLSNPNNYKMWKTKGLENSIMCHTGNCRDIGIVRFNNFIPEARALTGDIDMDFVQGQMIYDIFDALDSHGFLARDDDGPRMTSSFLFTYNDKIWELSSCSYVIEVDDYTAIGSGRDAAMGSLAGTVGEPIENRLIKAIVAASSIDMSVGYPIVITDTESCEFKLYDKNDIKSILNAN